MESVSLVRIKEDQRIVDEEMERDNERESNERVFHRAVNEKLENREIYFLENRERNARKAVTIGGIKQIGLSRLQQRFDCGKVTFCHRYPIDSVTSAQFPSETVSSDHVHLSAMGC